MAPRTRSRALLVTDTPAGGIEKLPEVMYPGKDVGTPSTRRQQFSHVGLAPSQVRQEGGGNKATVGLPDAGPEIQRTDNIQCCSR